ncbi:hypothetical protein SPRG_03809 [Saprolegnia parasitica CBS 223.65]|uniref:Uncharacterized protein n=1 Tax=Saprolegnia parasitica (strain CBS 223.65) TaxID=695850 RepID=A0A067CXH3_SAPPC|nr:hypothetical protein SPRG_03809 [Saprolegnia parasitica CBS 223.65]KDO31191.1 hypothetical protein SPRG_03809 [Saprolegnia parasitica CBS 223.65]|eukprot:XP_012197796.1 hypothetical protein SPRG_03809 [Saprolegnia parasitica CBS 223.65]
MGPGDMELSPHTTGATPPPTTDTMDDATVSITTPETRRTMRRRATDAAIQDDATMAVLARTAGTVFQKHYGGDVFGTRTESIDGLVYLSRIRLSDKPKKSLVHTKMAVVRAVSLRAHVDTNVVDDAAFRTKKRQCAITFEKMVYARLRDDNSGIKALLDNGIVPALLALTEVPDIQTQLHCARAFYGLARVPSTRRLMVLNGVIGTVAQLVRHDFKNAPLQLRLKQDYAAILCHLTEEVFLEEKMLHEGVDRVLAKLYRCHSSETKRIVGLAYFNLSHNTNQLKHNIDGFMQTLAVICKSINIVHHTTSSTLYLIKAIYNLTQNPAFHNILMAESAHRYLALPILHYQKLHFHKRDAHAVEVEAIQVGLLGLFSISLIKSGRQHIIQDNLVVYIVSCLGLVNSSAPDTVCSILYQLSTDEACRDAIVHEVKAIVEAMPNCSPYGYFALSWVFRNLCATKTIYPSLVDAGVLPVLLDMSRHDHDEVKLNGISCVVCFLEFDLHLQAAVDCLEFILQDLIGLLSAPQPTIVIFATTALFNLSCNDALQPLLCAPKAGLVPALQQLVVVRRAHTQGEKAVTAALLPLLYRLSCNADNRFLMVQADFFGFVAAAIPSTSAHVRQAALDTMLNFSTEEDHFPQGTDDVKSLLKTLYALKTNHDAPALRSCVSLLSHLTATPPNRELLLKTGCVVCLERMCNSADDFIMANCAHILYSLTETADAVDRVLREGAIPILIQLSRASSDHVKHLCLMTFTRISSFSGINVETKLVDQGAIAAAMIMALVASKSDAIKTSCVQLLSNCLSIQSKHCTKVMVENGVFWALSSLATLPDAHTKRICAICFCNIAIAYPVKMVEAGVPRSLVHLLEAGDTDTLVVALQAIANIVQNDKACAILVSEGLVKLLRSLVENKHPQVWHAAAIALLQMTRADDKCRVDNVRNGIIPWMQSVLHEQSIALQCLVMLGTISAYEPARKLMVAPDLMDLLRAVSAPDLARQSLCVQIVYNTSCELSLAADLVRGHAHAFLASCLPGGSPELQGMCAGAVHNLTCVQNDDVVATLVQSGVGMLLQTLYMLETLAAADRVWCVLAICNLALGKVNTARLVHDNGGVVLIDFVQAFRQASLPLGLSAHVVQRLVAAAMRKIVAPPGNQTVPSPCAARDGGLAALVDLTRVGVDEHMRVNCLESLHVLTRNTAHIERCLRDGLLTCVLEVADCTSPRVRGLCFTILTNICAIDFDAHQSGNVIAYLSQLSECKPAQLTPSDNDRYDVRGIDAPLPLAPLHTAYIAATPAANLGVENTPFLVPWTKWHEKTRPELPPAIPTVVTPVNIAVFTRNLPDSFKLPHTEVLPKEPLTRDDGGTDAAGKYVVGFKSLIKLQLQAHKITHQLGRRHHVVGKTPIEHELAADAAIAADATRRNTRRSPIVPGSLAPLGPPVRLRRASSAAFMKAP